MLFLKDLIILDIHWIWHAFLGKYVCQSWEIQWIKWHCQIHKAKSIYKCQPFWEAHHKWFCWNSAISCVKATLVLFWSKWRWINCQENRISLGTSHVYAVTGGILEIDCWLAHNTPILAPSWIIWNLATLAFCWYVILLRGGNQLRNPHLMSTLSVSNWCL